MRAKLLPTVSPRGAARAADRHIDVSCRVSVCGEERLRDEI